MKETTRTLIRLQPLFRELFADAVRLHLALLLALPLLVLAACVSPSERQRMETLLADYEQCNSQYDTLSIDSTRRLADFFSRHGDAHQRMRAYYLLGCAHETAGESPQALDLFYKSLEQADTTAKDCDYKRLSRIHGQMAQLLIHQLAFDNALKEIGIINRYAHLANDTLMIIANMEKKCYVLNLMGRRNEEYELREQICDSLSKYGMLKQRAKSVGAYIDLLLERKMYDKARRYIIEYETKSGFFDSLGNTTLKNKFFYYLKGEYYLQTGKFDSAAYYFRKEIREAGITNNLETGYLGLSHYYQCKNMPDSAAKYALLSRELNDSCYYELSTNYYQRMQASYNYSRAQRKTATLETKNTKLLAFNAIAIALLIIILLISYILFIKHKNRQEQAERDILEWREKYAELMQVKNEIVALGNMEKRDLSSIIADKEEQKEQLEKRINELLKQKQLAEAYNIEEALTDAPIVHLFKESISRRDIVIDNEQWHQMKQHVKQCLPTFLITIKEMSPDLTETEQRVCILIRLHFSLKGIASIEKITHQHLWIMRKRLLKKMFGIEGGAKDFDKNILKIA